MTKKEVVSYLEYALNQTRFGEVKILTLQGKEYFHRIGTIRRFEEYLLLKDKIKIYYRDIRSLNIV